MNRICLLIILYASPVGSLMASPGIRPLIPIQPSSVTRFIGCFVQPSADFPQEKTWLREALSSSWERFALINFSIAEVCPPVVYFYCHLSNTKPTRFVYIKTENSFNLTVYLYIPSTIFTNQTRKRFFSYEVVHEFGHLLGFGHEGRRLDTPAICQNETESMNGGELVTNIKEYVTSYDNESIMNYCNYTARRDRVGEARLSSLDIQGVRQIYGRRGSSKYTMPMVIGLILPLFFGTAVSSCQPKFAPCNDSSCYVNATGIRVCPDCCDDRLCLPPSIICTDRPPSFDELCGAVSEKIQTESRGNTYKAVEYVFSDAYKNKNCTVIVSRPPPSFRAVCLAVSSLISSRFGNRLYTSKYVLGDGHDNCIVSLSTT